MKPGVVFFFFFLVVKDWRKEVTVQGFKPLLSQQWEKKSQSRGTFFVTRRKKNKKNWVPSAIRCGPTVKCTSSACSLLLRQGCFEKTKRVGFSARPPSGTRKPGVKLCRPLPEARGEPRAPIPFSSSVRTSCGFSFRKKTKKNKYKDASPCAKYPAIVALSSCGSALRAEPLLGAGRTSCRCRCAREPGDALPAFTSQVPLELRAPAPLLGRKLPVSLSLWATWSSRSSSPGPVQTWGPGTGSSRTSGSRVPPRGRRRPSRRRRRRCWSPRSRPRCRLPTSPGAGPPAGSGAGPPAWRAPGGAAAARSSAAGSSAPGRGCPVGRRGASCPPLAAAERERLEWKGLSACSSTQPQVDQLNLINSSETRLKFNNTQFYLL